MIKLRFLGGFVAALFLLFNAWVAETCPADAETDSPYGVCAHVSRGDEHAYAQQEFKLMLQAGIRWVRTDFDWSGVERKPGEWRFEHLDETVEWAEAAGIRLLPILDYDVPWARPAYRHLDLWLAYVRRVVSRYKDRIRFWEVWNEPNLESFWRDKPDPKNYVTLLEATYGEIKKIDPKLVVVLGGVAGIPWSYLEGIYQAGGKDFFDVMNVHPYRYPAGPEERPLYEDLRKLRELMATYGDGEKPIWITEIGWPTHQGPRGISPENQAKMLTRSYLLALAAGVQKIFWYEFQSPEFRADYNEHHFGIVHRDLSPKPAYEAYRTLTSLVPPGRTLQLTQPPGQGIYQVGWYDLNGRQAWAIWRVDKAEKIRLKSTGRPSRIVDHLGRDVSIQEPEVGTLMLNLDDGPIFIIGPDKLEFTPTEKTTGR